MSRFAGWHHCPRCRGALVFGARGDEARDVLHCPACGLVLYDNPAPTASALVVRDGRLMLTRRARQPYEGMWDVPGGFVEPLEHPEQAVRRELLEETGLEVEVGPLIGVFTDVYGEDGVATFNLYYSASVLSGDERPADDVSEIGWFPLAEVPLHEVAFANGREAIVTFVRKS
jgi:ADP-ribose pyrophosphatase YjhB (NUDIX family)